MNMNLNVIQLIHMIHIDPLILCVEYDNWNEPSSNRKKSAPAIYGNEASISNQL